MIQNAYEKYKIEKRNNQYILYYFLTNDCNLNCYRCDHFCCKNKEHWYISIEDFTEQCNIIKEKLPNLNTLHLFGGEPLLHPHFIELYNVCYNIFKNTNVKITINTNGLLLQKFNSLDLLTFQHNNTKFLITEYPDFIDINKQNIQKLQNNNINFIHHTPDFFSSIIIRKEKHDEIIDLNYYNCSQIWNMERKTDYILYQNRLLGCYFGMNAIDFIENHLHQFSFENNKDYINIYQLQNENELFQLKEKPNNFCSYCQEVKSFGKNRIPWGLQKDISEDYNDYTKTLLEIFLDEYNKFLKIQNSHSIYKKSEGVEYFNGPEGTTIFEKRYETGIIDIFIPYNNFSNIYNDFKLILQNQTMINKINIYFTSINADRESEIKMFLTNIPFDSEEINVFHLKSNNLENGYKHFLENSYSPKKYTFSEQDIIKIKNDNTFFEHI